MQTIERQFSRWKLSLRVSAGIAVAAAALTAIFILATAAVPLRAQASGPTMTAPNLAVRTAVDGFVTPIGLAFLSDSKWLVIEKNTGQVQVVEDGAVTGTALDLAVNNFSERGLLGIALHPDFEENNFVYLFWSCTAAPPPEDNPFIPTANECAVTRSSATTRARSSLCRCSATASIGSSGTARPTPCRSIRT